MKMFCSMFALLLVIGLGSARADQGQLHGSDAAEMGTILDHSGFHGIWDVTYGFVAVERVYCTGLNYVDSCVVAMADALPAAGLVPLKAHDTQAFWGLLHKAGVENQPGKDHDAGKATISAARVDCTLYSDPSQDVCTVQ